MDNLKIEHKAYLYRVSKHSMIIIMGGGGGVKTTSFLVY